MKTRLFLILVLALIPFVDALVQFPSGSLVELPAHGLVDRRETHLYAVSAGASWWEHDGELLTGVLRAGGNTGPGQRSRSESDPLPTAPEREISNSSKEVNHESATRLDHRPGGCPVPDVRDGPGVRGNSVAGIATYYHPSLAHPSVQGKATWYGGSAFNGRPQANGQPFDPWAMTAASNEWPLGTVLEVEYRAVITVTVTDHGNFNHLLDLSQGAFHSLMLSNEPGVIPVTVRPIRE